MHYIYMIIIIIIRYETKINREMGIFQKKTCDEKKTRPAGPFIPSHWSCHLAVVDSTWFEFWFHESILNGFHAFFFPSHRFVFAAINVFLFNTFHNSDLFCIRRMQNTIVFLQRGVDWNEKKRRQKAKRQINEIKRNAIGSHLRLGGCSPVEKTITGCWKNLRSSRKWNSGLRVLRSAPFHLFNTHIYLAIICH